MRRIVLDTNCLIQIISPHSRYHIIWRDFIEGKLEICASTEILEEYYEILSKLTTSYVAENILKAITNNPNAVLVNPTFRFGIIIEDPDDNKFVDCAIVGQADYIVSNDRHFEEVKRCNFPKIEVLTLNEYMDINYN